MNVLLNAKVDDLIEEDDDILESMTELRLNLQKAFNRPVTFETSGEDMEYVTFCIVGPSDDQAEGILEVMGILTMFNAATK